MLPLFFMIVNNVNKELLITAMLLCSNTKRLTKNPIGVFLELWIKSVKEPGTVLGDLGNNFYLPESPKLGTPKSKSKYCQK